MKALLPSLLIVAGIVLAVAFWPVFLAVAVFGFVLMVVVGGAMFIGSALTNVAQAVAPATSSTPEIDGEDMADVRRVLAQIETDKARRAGRRKMWAEQLAREEAAESKAAEEAPERKAAEP